MQSAEIGQFSLDIDGKNFSLIPSLRNMAKLASSKKILSMYDMIHSPVVPDWLRLDIARDIFIACCDKKSIANHLIKTRNMKPHLNSRCISANDQIVVAASLIRHGVAGVNRPKYAGSSKSSGKGLDEFNVNKIVADAMIHFSLSEEEALNLTMSKFYYLLSAKFPSDSVKQDTPSMEQHKAAMKALREEQQ